MERPILTYPFTSQPLPAAFIEGDRNGNATISWRSMQQHLDATLGPENWDWIIEANDILLATEVPARDGTNRLCVVTSVRGRLVVRTSAGPVSRSGIGSGTGFSSLGTSTPEAYSIALYSADRNAFKRAAYLLGAFYGLWLGDRDTSLQQLIASGNEPTSLPRFVKTPLPPGASIVESPLSSKPSSQPPEPASPEPHDSATGNGEAQPSPGPHDNTAASPSQRIRAAWTREHQAANALPDADRYRKQTEIDTRYSNLLAQAGDPRPTTRILT